MARRENKNPAEARPVDQSFKESWEPKTQLGKNVKNELVESLDAVLDKGSVILETQIVDSLASDLKTDLLLVGQAKGKFGGGQRRVFRQTQKKTKEGNKPSFFTMAVVGNNNGFVGLGNGKARETVPAREKAIRSAKLSLIKVRRGCGSWECGCKAPHSIPYTVEGKVGSVTLQLIPAPRGTGLCVEKECAKVLELAGIKDVWSRTQGKTSTKINLLKACFEALKQLSSVRVQDKYTEQLGIADGKLNVGKSNEQ